ncbi:probable SET and MYND domain-containing protein 5 [Coccomyxa sp. Obi]|nr:probable SET and MYND domain-containing protein 5 [Coccomyxa sp. Obi]
MQALPEDARQAQQLLQPLPSHLAASYFHEVIGKLGESIEVRLASQEKGRGLFASKDFAEEELIFKEPPLVGAQHTSNRADALVCSHCFSFIGSIGIQIAHRLLSRKDAEPIDVNPDYLRSLWSGVAELPYSNRFPLRKLVTCIGGCTDSVYCSEECAAANWAAHHQLLCCGPRAQPSPVMPPAETEQPRRRSSFEAFRESRERLQTQGLYSMTPPVRREAPNIDKADAIRMFKEHADETNDAFHIAAQVVAGTLLRADELLSSNSTPGSAESSEDRSWTALQRAWRPYAAAWKAPWWECVAIPEDVTDADAFRSDLRELASDSLELLKAFLYDDRFPGLFHLDVYGSIVGMFELNNLDLFVASPVEDYFELCHGEDSSLSAEEQHLTQLTTRPLLDALGEAYDAACEGSAFYALQSCCNHSCAPNAHAFKRAHIDTDGSAVVLAKRAIASGEEVCLSYIDEDAPYHERRAALADYGFVCSCEKCAADAAAPGKAAA